jgi:phospholipid transport system substrate-binding protein
MNMNFKAFVFSLMLAGFAAPAAAQEVAPDVLVKGISNEVLDIIRKDKDIQAGNTKKIVDLVETKVLPHFNFTRMTAYAVGVNWRRASPEQQKLLIDQFRTLLVRTYSTALSSYKNQVIDFKPLRAQAADTEVKVRSEIKQSGAQAVTIDYTMEKTPAGWKVFDVEVGGVSLVANYRETFTNEIRTAGIDGLIKTLASKNKQLEAKT